MNSYNAYKFKPTNGNKIRSIENDILFENLIL